MTSSRPRPRTDVDRRLELVENDVDRLLDPETGIYALLRAMEGRLKSVAIMVLIACLVNLIAIIAGVHVR